MRKLVVKSVTFVIFGLLIGSFAVWGIGDIFQGAQPNTPIAEVGDTEISQQEFSRTLSREINRLSSRLGSRFDIEQARALGVVDQVVDQMVGRALFDQKIADLRLTVTEDLLKQRITEEPAFRNEAGQFDRNRFVQTLQQANMGEQEFLDSLRRDILRQQLVGSITQSAAAPRALADSLYAYRQETRTARVLRVPNDGFQDMPQPDEAALEAFHKEFSDNFMAPEQRAVSFIELNAASLAAETAIPQSELQAEFEARRDDFAVPERRNVVQIVFDDEAAANAAMDRFREGAKFESVAQDVTGGAPIELGTLERRELPEELAEAAFAVKQGDISEPVKSAIGWHILRVLEIQPAEEPVFDKVVEDLAQDMAMARAIDGTIAIANQLDDELAAGASLEQAADSLDLQVRRIAALDRDGNDADSNAIIDLPQDNFARIAFDTAPGEESLLTEIDEGGFFILRVDSTTPSQLRPLSEVHAEVVELWRDSQRAERAREAAKQLAERARQGESLEAIGQAEGYKVETSQALTRFETDPSRSFAPSLTSKLFDLAPGEIDTVAASDSHIVLELLDVAKADPMSKETEVTALRESLSNAMRNDILEQFMGTLRGEYGVSVNQQVIDNLLVSF